MMRKYVLPLVLLFCGVFSLSAQSRTDASIYVPPVTGLGSNPEDNTLFYKQLVFELTEQYFKLAKAREGADYSLIGSLSPYDGRQFSIYLELRNNKTGEITVEGELLYETVDDVSDQFSALVSTLVYTIPDETGTKWRNNWVYVGASVFWTPRIYFGVGDNKNSSTNYANPGGGLSLELHLFDFMSVEAGLEITTDRVKISENRDYWNPLLEIPILLKYVIKPGAWSWFMVEPYAGAQFNILFPDATDNIKPPLLTVVFGLQYGVKAGPGTFFIDGRVGIDWGESTINVSGRKEPDFQRFIIHLGFGYKFGFFQKVQK